MPPWTRRVVLVALVVSTGGLTFLSRSQPFFAWDVSVAAWATGLSAPGLQTTMVAVSLPGTIPGVLASVALASAVVARWVGKRQAAAVLSVLLLDAVNEGLKALVGRPRPDSPGGVATDSFPSGHAFNSVVLLGVLWWVVAPRLRSGRQRAALGAAMVAVAVVVGFSRVYLGRHWPSDVLGGYLAGGLGLCLLVLAWDRVGRLAGNVLPGRKPRPQGQGEER